MARSSTIDATYLSETVKTYKTEHPTASNNTIAQALGISKMHVGRILAGKVKSVEVGETWKELEAIVQARRATAAVKMERYGTYTAVKELRRGYKNDQLPSEDTINRWLQDVPDSKVARTSAKSSNRTQYWSERRPDGPQQRGLIDTATTIIGEETVTLLLYIDWYSRAAHIEIVHKSFARHLPWFLRRAFTATGGVPHTLQTDNGFGFIQTSHRNMSKAMDFALSEGVTRWEFIPVTEAQRNGKVERLVQTAKDYLENTAWENVPQAQIALASWLHEYNTIRVHKGLTQEHGGRKKGNWKTPSDLCTYMQPTSEEPKVAIKKGNHKGKWEIVYKRYVASGCAVIAAPSTFIPVSPQLSGRYVDIIIHSDAVNEKMHHAEITYTETVCNEETGELILVTHVIGTFDHLAPQVYPTYHAHPTFKPIPTDEQAILRAQMKHLKTRKPRPGWVLPGITRKDIESHHWQLIDDATGEILYDTRYSQDIDHLQEYAQ